MERDWLRAMIDILDCLNAIMVMILPMLLFSFTE